MAQECVAGRIQRSLPAAGENKIGLASKHEGVRAPQKWKCKPNQHSLWLFFFRDVFFDGDESLSIKVQTGETQDTVQAVPAPTGCAEMAGHEGRTNVIREGGEIQVPDENLNGEGAEIKRMASNPHVRSDVGETQGSDGGKTKQPTKNKGGGIGGWAVAVIVVAIAVACAIVGASAYWLCCRKTDAGPEVGPCITDVELMARTPHGPYAQVGGEIA